MQQVGRLGLGGQAGRGPAPLDVDDEQRQLEADGQADGLALERDARAAGGGDAEVAAEGGAEGRADGGDLVFGLEGAHAEVLVLGQLVEDVGRRRDRVAAEEERQAGQLAGGDQAPGQRGVAGDVGVVARRRAWPAAPRSGWSNSSAVSPKAYPARKAARLASRTSGFLAKRSSIHSIVGSVGRRVHPRDEAEGEEVLRAVGVAGLDAERRGAPPW